jgi:hypothetical protein
MSEGLDKVGASMYGIESTPTQVHARGESGRCSRTGGPSDSHKIATLVVMDVASPGAG